MSNGVFQAGKLTRDPEVRQVGENKVAKFGIAVRRTFKQKDGIDVDFFDCEVWGKLAEIAEQYLKKGSFVAYKGRLRNDSWDKEGTKMTKTMHVIEEFTMGPQVDKGDSEPTPAPASAPKGKRPAPVPQPNTDTPF